MTAVTPQPLPPHQHIVNELTIWLKVGFDPVALNAKLTLLQTLELAGQIDRNADPDAATAAALRLHAVLVEISQNEIRGLGGRLDDAMRIVFQLDGVPQPYGKAQPVKRRLNLGILQDRVSTEIYGKKKTPNRPTRFFERAHRPELLSAVATAILTREAALRATDEGLQHDDRSETPLAPPRRDRWRRIAALAALPVVGIVAAALIISLDRGDETPHPNAVSVSLDITQSARREAGQAGSTSFADLTRVRARDVVQLGTIVQNIEDPHSGSDARDFSIRLVVPRVSARVLRITAQARASNRVPASGYRSFDATTLRARARPIRLMGLRNIAIQINNRTTPGEPDWGRPIAVPDDQIRAIGAPGSWIVDLEPTPDRRLTPRYSDVLRVLALVDVSPGTPTAVPQHLAATMHVRRVGGTPFWGSRVSAPPGTEIDYRLRLVSTGSRPATRVVARISLPSGVSYFPGSARISTSGQPRSRRLPDAVIGPGVDLGTYAPGAIAYIVLRCQIGSMSTPERPNAFGVVRSDQTPRCGTRRRLHRRHRKPPSSDFARSGSG